MLIQGAKGRLETILFLRGANLSRVSLIQQVKSKKDDLSHSESLCANSDLNTSMSIDLMFLVLITFVSGLVR